MLIACSPVLEEFAVPLVILRDCSLSVVGTGLGLAPSLAFFFGVLLFLSGTLAFKGLHGVSNGGILLGFLSLFSLILNGLSNLLLRLRVSVHEEINNHIPGLVAWDITSKLEDLTSEEPEDVSDGVLTLVVGWNGDVDVVKG